VWPLFGQFIAHDITADRSPLGHHADPERVRNFRTPRANLEGVYAAGDVRSGSIKRCATAVGEGAAVVRFVHEHLEPEKAPQTSRS